MSYSCSNCSKTFSNKKYLLRHVSNQVCTKQHICDKCDREFTSAYNLRAHLNKKKPCVPNKVPVIDVTKDDTKCPYCGNNLSTIYTLKRHIGTCSMKGNSAMVKMMMDQNKLLFQQNQLLIQQQNQPIQITNNNNTVNVQNNLYVNVTFCSFGKEDLSRLDTSKVMEILGGQVEDFMPRMIEHVHANPEHPEYHNVFYDPKRRKAIVFCAISDTEMSWQMRDFGEVSAHIAKKIQEHMQPTNSPYYNMATSVKDYETANKITAIANHVNWISPEAIEKTKEPLSQVVKNKEFMKIVEVVE